MRTAACVPFMLPSQRPAPVVSPSMRRSPQIHKRSPRFREVIAQRPHFAGEQLRFVLAAASRALVFAEEEDLVHAGVEGAAVAGFGEFIDQVEHHGVDAGVQRAVAAAIDALVFRIPAGRFVELRVRAEQRVHSLSPTTGAPGS